MSRLTVIALAVFIFTISVRCLADPIGDGPSPIRKLDLEDPDEDEVDRSASPQGFSRPGAYTPRVEHLAECYTCTDCPKVFANISTKYCPFTNDVSKNKKCIVISEKYAQMDRPWFIRGCASERGSCAEIKAAHDNTDARLVKLTGCWECDGDKCNTNGVHRSLPNLTGAVFILIITPVLGKYTLS